MYKLDSRLAFTAYVALDINIWAVPKIRGAILGAPIIRSIVYWGTLILGKLPYSPCLDTCRLPKLYVGKTQGPGVARSW